MNNAADIHMLTGAYAVDALPDDERERFEQHLAECEACQVEVRELQATAAQLGTVDATGPPASLKHNVIDEIRRTRQEPAHFTPTSSYGSTQSPSSVRLQPRWYQRMLVPAAAATVLVVLGLTAVIANLNTRLAELETLAAPVTDVLTAADVITLVQQGPDGARMRLVASPTRGEGVFLVGGMEPAPPDRIYQLWLLRGEQATPAGLFDVDERGRGARVMTGDMSDVTAVALTVEPEGGSPQPTTDPITVMELPTDPPT